MRQCVVHGDGGVERLGGTNEYDSGPDTARLS